MFQYIRAVRVDYVVQKSSVTTLYIDHWQVCHADRQTDRQTDKFGFFITETKFYKLII